VTSVAGFVHCVPKNEATNFMEITLLNNENMFKERCARKHCVGLAGNLNESLSSGRMIVKSVEI